MTGDGREAERATLLSPPLTALLLGLAFAALYLSTLTADHNYDGVVYALMAERAVGSGELSLQLFNPAHVLYTATGAGLLALLQGAGIPVSGLQLLQVASALAGAALVGLLHLRLSEWTRSQLLAAGGALGTGLAAGVWFYATDAECNMPAQLLSLLALGAAVAFLEKGGRWMGIGGGALLGLTAAFHLTLGTLWIALLAASATGGRTRLLRCAGMIAFASAVLAAAYLPRVAFLLDRPGPFRAVQIVSFPGESAGGGYLMRRPFHPRAEYLEMLRGFAIGEPGAGCRAAALPLRAVPVAWTLAGAAAVALRRGGLPLRVCGAWFLGNWVLYAAWAWRNLEFTSFHIVPLALFGTLGLASLVPAAGRRAVAWGTIVVALAAGAANGSCWIAPGLSYESNGAWRTARFVASRTAPGDRVVVTGEPDLRLKVYIPYFAMRQAVVPEFYYGPAVPEEESLRRLDRDLAEACREGAALFALPPLVGEGEAGGGDFPLEAVRRYLLTLEPEPAARGEGLVLYRLTRCPG